MLPPDLYRSEAFAEDLPEGGYEPLALRLAQPQQSPARRGWGLLGAVRAAFSARRAHTAPTDRAAAVQLA